MRLTGSPSSQQKQGSLYSADAPDTANLSDEAREYIKTLTTQSPDDTDLSRVVWLHALAIIYAPLYLTENDAGVRSDLPRIPLPNTVELLKTSAALGITVGKLLDAEKPVLGVTNGKLRKELAILGKITGPVGLSLEVTAGWGHIQKEDIVMPGSGQAKEREFTEAEKAALDEGATELGMTLDAVIAIFGSRAVDIHLNGESHWATVPLAAWEYTIGGYLVLKKWLSYRESAVLGREITKDEAREFTHMVRRISALLLLEPSLDANYLAIKAAAYDWLEDTVEKPTVEIEGE